MDVYSTVNQHFDLLITCLNYFYASFGIESLIHSLFICLFEAWAIDEIPQKRIMQAKEFDHTSYGERVSL